MILTTSCLVFDITAALLTPQLPQTRRQMLPHIPDKKKEFFSASASGKLHSNTVRPLCFLFRYNVVTHIGLTTSGSPLWHGKKPALDIPRKELLLSSQLRSWGTVSNFQRWHRSLTSSEIVGLWHLTDWCWLYKVTMAAFSLKSAAQILRDILIIIPLHAV